MRRAVLGLTLIIFLAAEGRGQEAVEPKHVLQVVESVNGTLEAMAAANFSPSPAQRIDVTTPRQPRHVLVKVFEALFQLQLLRRLHGLTPRPLPLLPPHEPLPEDVKQAVDALRTDIIELAEVFGVAPVPELPLLQADVAPRDVFNALSRTVDLINALDVPPIAPNTVYRVVETIIAVIEEIREARNITASPVPVEVGGAAPEDVYAVARELLQRIERLAAEHPDFAVAGGVIVLPQHEGPIEPAHVIDVLGAILAELSVIKINHGIEQPTALAREQSGRLPAHVFARITHAGALLDTLQPEQQQ